MPHDSLIHTEIGRLFVQSLLRREGYKRYYQCACACGTTVEKTSSQLVEARSHGYGSCGCLRTDLLIARSTKHGLCRTPEYQIWKAMHGRCTTATCSGYSDYGARGITVCAEWEDFARFYADMGPRPSPKHELDRKKNNKGYYKNNCHWTTRKVNTRNRRSTLKVTFRGQRISLAELAERAGLAYDAAYWRLYAGWSPEKIFITPSTKKGNLK